MEVVPCCNPTFGKPYLYNNIKTELSCSNIMFALIDDEIRRLYKDNTKFGDFTRTACWFISLYVSIASSKTWFLLVDSLMIQLGLICQYGHSFGSKLLLHGVQILSAYLDHFEFWFAPRYLCMKSGHYPRIQLNLIHSRR